MSRRKRNLIVCASTLLVLAFTVWNVSDFVQSERRSTAGYVALIFNGYALLELGRMIWREVTHHD